MAAPILKWKRVTNTTGPAPRPRHGHRAVSIKDLMIVFGGGNEGIVDELHVYNTTTNQWFVPPVKGDIPPGCAAYGFVCDGTRLLVFGGMVEYGKYSNELYELQASRWEWKRLKPRPPKNGLPPCPRLGHSFTLIGNKAYLFGGLANDSDDPKNNIPRYLNDLCTLELKPYSSVMTWDSPQVFGQPPPPRESHTAVGYFSFDNKQPRLIIYGGMSGCRLGDLWQLEIDTMQWHKPVVNGIPPLPRSLHSATLIGNRMFVFGGWVPLVMDDSKAATHEKEWKCTNTLASLNLETMTWEPLAMEVFEDAIPRARAGHCSVAINSRLYVWSGRDGYRKAWNNQVCCKDLWYLETEKPPLPSRVQLVRASTTTLEVCWGSVPTADAYLLQLQKYDMPPVTSVSAASVSQASTTQAAHPLSAMTTTPSSQPLPSPSTPTTPTTPTTPVRNQLSSSSVAVSTPKTSMQPLIPQHSPSVQTRSTAVTHPTVRLPVTSTAIPVVRGGTMTVVHTKASGVVGTQQIRLVTAGPSGTQVIRKVAAVNPVTTAKTTAVVTSMSGMAALAAAAAATQKITMTMTQTTPTSSNIRVVSPSALTPQGVRINHPVSVQGTRTANSATILKTAGGTPGKQIITVHKAGATSSQPQIVTLVKTTQGVTVAAMPKVSLIQGKAGTLQGHLQSKTSIPQGATIVKLVTTQGGSIVGKPGTAIITTQAGTTQPKILGISSISPQGTIQTQKMLNTIIRTLPSNVLSVAKPGSATVLGSTTTGNVPKQTIVIAAPKGSQPGTPAKILTTFPKLSSPSSQIIVVTTHPHLKTVMAGAATVEAGRARTGTSTVNVLPISAGTQLKTVNTSSGIKMIVVSGAGIGAGQQAITILTTNSSSSGVQGVSTVTSPIAITVPASPLHSGAKTATFAVPEKSTTSTVQQPGSSQILAVPAQGILPTGSHAITLKTKSGTTQKVLTIVTTQPSLGSTPQAQVTGSQPSPSVSVVTTQALSGVPISAIGNSAKVMIVSAPTTSQTLVTADNIGTTGVQLSESLEGAGDSVDQKALAATDLDLTQAAQLIANLVSSKEASAVEMPSQLSSVAMETDDSESALDQSTVSHMTEQEEVDTLEPMDIHYTQSDDGLMSSLEYREKVHGDGINIINGEGYEQLSCTDDQHCGEDQQPCIDKHCDEGNKCTDGIHCGEEKECVDGKHCGEEKEYTNGTHYSQKQECSDGIHCDEEKECTDGKHCGEDKECSDGIHCGEEKECTDGIHCGEEKECTDGKHCGEDKECSDSKHCGEDKECTNRKHCGGDKECTDRKSFDGDKECTDGKHCGEDKKCTDGKHCGEDKECTDGKSCGEDKQCIDKDCGKEKDFTIDKSNSEEQDNINNKLSSEEAKSKNNKPSGVDNVAGQNPSKREIREAVDTLASKEISSSDDSAQNVTDSETQGSIQSQLTLERPGAMPPAQMCADDPEEPTVGSTETNISSQEAKVSLSTSQANSETEMEVDSTTQTSAENLGSGNSVSESSQPMDTSEAILSKTQTSYKDHSEISNIASVQSTSVTLSLQPTPVASTTTTVTQSEVTSTPVLCTPHLSADSGTSSISNIASASTDNNTVSSAMALHTKVANVSGKSSTVSSSTISMCLTEEKTSEPAVMDASDPLATLASAAISSASDMAEAEDAPVKHESTKDESSDNTNLSIESSTPVVKSEPLEDKVGIPISEVTPKIAIKRDSHWYDVGFFKGNSAQVTHFFLPSEQSERKEDDIDVVSVPNHSMLKKQELLPGTAYKFRVAAINACGRGPWSEISAFKTCLPGFPGAPSAIKISKGADGAHLSWEAPQNTSGEITEYSVYLAVRSATTGGQGDGAKTTVTSNPSQLAFVRVYCGPKATCTVNNNSLASAHVDTTMKPAIIFRIAARNEKGYGPATQVRWLQDGAPAAVRNSVAVKRPATSLEGTSKKVRTD
ncbi:host cell factor 1-like isoform X3 [Limulus polyphemus]|uniref:Host cell factor 1-like isoform X3 n=1 Tax=Limulus polyphemus TaxID=6850 RepID=A0ABM1S958_LIMPO|nr:host cell factor 1-like isoform X3 [Limulus polyphemus]